MQRTLYNSAECVVQMYVKSITKIYIRYFKVKNLFIGKGFFDYG